jgi:hypothetical protein
MVKTKSKKVEGEVSHHVTRKLFFYMSLFVFFTGSCLAVSALIDVSGYHIPLGDVWTCTEDHNMDLTCATLRDEIGKLTHF